MRHFLEIGHDDSSRNVFSERQGQPVGVVLIVRGFEEFPKHNCGAVVIGNFNTYRRFAWNAVNAYRFRLQRKAEVVAEAGDPGVFDTGLGLEFECRYNRSRMNLLNRAHRFEFASFLFDQARPFPKFVLVHCNRCGREVEQGCRRKFRTGRRRFG